MDVIMTRVMREFVIDIIAVVSIFVYLKFAQKRESYTQPPKAVSAIIIGLLITKMIEHYKGEHPESAAAPSQPTGAK